MPFLLTYVLDLMSNVTKSDESSRGDNVYRTPELFLRLTKWPFSDGKRDTRQSKQKKIKLENTSVRGVLHYLISQLHS